MIRAVHSTTWLLVGALAAISCEAYDCKTENESREMLRQVPVPLGSVGADAAPPTAAGAVVRRQSYTIDRDGDFTFHRSIETAVAHLGVVAGALDQQTAESLGVEPFSGVLVHRVEKKSPASFAGMKVDDVIVTFAGKPVLSSDRLEYLLEEKKPGDLVAIEVLRARERIQIKAELGSEKRIESANGIQQKLEVLDDRNRTGLKLVELTDEARPIVLGSGTSEKGLLVMDLMPGGPAYFAGVRPRDYLTKVGDQPIGTIAEYESAMGALDTGDDARFVIYRNGVSAHAEVRLASSAMADSGFKVPFIVNYERKPEHRKFSLLLGFLFNHERCFSVREKEGAFENYSSRNWGAVLDLIEYEGNSRGKGRLRFLWLIPIWWGGN
jgi:hypothetical protein